MYWHTSEIYACKDPGCESKILVVQEPRRDPARAAPPRCACGKALERQDGGVGEPVSVPLASQAEVKRDPAEEPE